MRSLFVICYLFLMDQHILFSCFRPHEQVVIALIQIHQETFGKSGCRRIVPGQYLGVDPKGRACMISAIEKQKLVYILNRDSAARLTISSPLEAHKSHTLVYHLVGVDVGFDNPMFACLELDYEVCLSVVHMFYLFLSLHRKLTMIHQEKLPK